MNVVRNRSAMRESNGHELSRESAHHAADSLITTMAAAIGTPAARDLALEASNTLDEMAAAGATADELMRTARVLARQFPLQLRDRSRTDVIAPDLPSSVGAGHRAPRAAHWFVFTNAREAVELKSMVVLARSRGVKVFRSAPRGRGEFLTLWLEFAGPVAEHEVFFALGWSPLVRVIRPDVSEGGLGPRTAG